MPKGTDLSKRRGLSVRWAKARADSEGFRAWKRELGGTVTAGLLTWYVRRNNPDALLSDIMAIAIAVVATAVVIPLVEFGWNFATARRRLAEEEVARLFAERATLLDSIAEREASISCRLGAESIGEKLAALHGAGFALKQGVIASDDQTSAAHWGERIDQWRDECRNYLATNVSPGKAAYWDSFGSLMAIDIIGLKSATTYSAKVKLIQRIDERLGRLEELLKAY
jgi:hypothetical protein